MRTKILNYLFLFIFSVYVIFLFSRVFLEKIPKNIFVFCSLYFCITIIPLIFRFLFNWYRRKKVLVISDKTKTSFFKKLKDAFIKFLIKIDQSFEKVFYKEFLFSFLEKRFFFSRMFYSFVNLFEKIIGHFYYFLLLFIRLPWYIFLLSYLYEILTGNFFVISLYLLSLNFLIKFLIRSFLFLVAAFALRQSNQELIIYFLPFIKDNRLNAFFFSNPMIRKLLLFNGTNSKLSNKRMISLIWESFVKIFHFAFIRIHVDQLSYLIFKENKFQRLINLTVFGFYLVVYLNQSLFNQDLIIAFSSLLTIVIISKLSFDHSSENLLDESKLNTIPDIEFLYNRKAISSQHLWFISAKENLLNKYAFLEFSDLVYPYVNNVTAKQLYLKGLEINNISLQDNDFSKISDFKFTKEEALAIKESIDLIVEWFNLEVSNGRIDLKTNSFVDE